MAEYKQGEGTDQKPKGEAKRLNDATPPPTEQPVPVPGEAPARPARPDPNLHGPVSLAGPDANLFGPSNDKGPLSAGVGPAMVNTPPSGAGAWLQDIVTAAQDPNAPPQLKALLELVMYHLNEGGRG